MTPTGTGLAVPESLPPVRSLPGDLDYDAFERGDVLGHGGDATVYAATVGGDPERVVALKEPRADGAGVVVDRFRQEAETWAGLADHDHVVTVHAWGTDPRPWLAMEYMDGGNLVESAGAWGLDRGLWTGARVAAAVEHAHRNSVAHLDLTPANVLLRATPGDAWPVPKVADWGMARAVRSEPVNLEGLSPRYASPEQFDPDRFGEPGTTTDVYQLGVVLYELLVGSPPFEGSPRGLRDAIVEQPPPPPSGRAPGLPAPVDDLLDRALAKAPADRYGSMAAFRRALEALLAERTGYEPEGTDATVAVDGPAGAAEPSPAGEGSTYERAVALAGEGFVRLSEGYFARREPAPPLDAWRGGVTLADARAGRAVERTAHDGDDQVSLGGRLLDGLREGTDHVVLGPPGSGKSTVCKRVACEWFDRGYGPVFYRESGPGERFEDPDALARQVSEAGGHALVVVEDAVRPEATAAFEFLDRVRDTEDVTVLLDARESEWRETDRGRDPFGPDAVGRAREALEPVYVPRPDGPELERFVRAAEAATDRSLDLDPEQLRREAAPASADDDEEQGRPGELFYVLHRLTSLARDPLADDGRATSLTDAVADAFDRLAEAGEVVLDVGVCANVLNAAGIGIHPELLHAVAPEEPLAVADAVDVLEGGVVFPRDADWSDGTTAYPAVHAAWSTAFLAHLLETEGEADASELVGRVITRVLSLADDAGLREQVRGALGGTAPYLARIERDPGMWADETVESFHALGRERPKLAPLYGDGSRDSVALPDACSEAIHAKRPVSLGWLFLAGGYNERAEAAFERLPETDEELGVERLLGLARVADRRGEYETEVDRARRCLSLVAGTDRRSVSARANLAIGRALRELGEYDSAEDHYRSALEGFRAVDDRRRTGRTLNSLGRLARRQSDYERASDCYRRSLEIDRSIGHRRGEAQSQTNLGVVALEQGEYDLAREYFERSLEIQRAIGARQGVANSLTNLGLVAHRRGAFDRAREYLERSLELKESLGDRSGVSTSLNNLGLVALDQGAYERARENFERSRDILERHGTRYGLGRTLNNLGFVARHLGDFERARDYHERSLELKEEVGDRHATASTLGGLGDVAFGRGAYERAREYYERSLAINEEFDDRSGVAGVRNDLGTVAHERGDYERAREHFEWSLEVHRDDDRSGEATSLAGLGVVASKRGDHQRAKEYLTESLAIAREAGIRLQVVKNLYWLGKIATREGAYDRAEEHLREAAEVVDDRVETARIRRARGRTALARDDCETARDLATRSLEAFESMGAAHSAARSRRLLGEVAAADGDHDTARGHWRAALETFESVGAPDDALATLESLVATCREAGDDAAVER